MLFRGDPSEKDWQLFRKKIRGWQDAYMGKLVQEYMEILQKDVSASERFWTLEERIKKDRKNPGLIVEMSRRRLLSNLANLAAYGVIHKSDLEEFSDKMKKILKKSWTIMELITNKFQCIDKKGDVTKFIPTKKALPRIIWSGAEPFVL